jgi:hypothetical protein
MAQSHLIANLDRHEFILPTSLQLGNQLTALAGGYGAMAALTLLIASSNGKGTGDVYWYEGSEDDGHRSHHEHPVARHIIGRWAGERIAIIGDYYDADNEDAQIGLPKGAYKAIEDQQDGWVDISEHVAVALDIDVEIRTARHKVHTQPSGEQYSEADGYNVNNPLPRAPRSLLDEHSGEITAIAPLPPVDPRSEPVEATPLAAKDLPRLHDALAGCTNGSGPLEAEMRQEIALAAEHPTKRTWDAIASKIIDNRSSASLWSAIGMLDHDFPMSVKRNEVDERQWPRIPDGASILQAVELARQIAEDPQIAERYRSETERMARRWGPPPPGAAPPA